MEYFLTEEQQMIVDLARKIAQEKIKPVREHYDETEEFPWPIVEELAKADLCGVYIPQEYGGFGGGVMNLVLVVEELCKVDGGISLALAATALGTFPILLGGNEEQKKKYLPDIASGKKLAAFGLTEPEAGSDATSMRTTAKKEGDYYVLNGTKCFITNAGDAETYTVFAKTNPGRGPRGISCFILEKGMKGFEFGKKEKKMGIRASSTRELIFNNCMVPRENLIGKEGHGLLIAQGTLDTSRPGVAAQALGIAAGALEEAISYARTRVQFGQPISSFQAIQHMLADMATEVEAARCLLYQTARMMDANPGKRTTKESAMSKLYASEVAMRVTTNAVQIFGGYGYIREYPVEKMMRDAKITQIYEGTSQIQRNEIALNLIKENAAKK
ncbi:MAG: acyl-CoA dehydrogenase [Elusimicrobia bacterium RIFOXYA2_FULL_50_26]|nr:MAG: acyl-CoA dehydrogenase [Elusimicrobia bacterium RIFOXYA2_FULL_50_26]OGS22858.1 MAG: acyl-CoA dehydrogenase [Elusimicrobia bacterium RIFOXYB2_FULL_50_12]